MTTGDADRSFADAIIREHVGPGSGITEHDRSIRTPMNLLLDVAERALGRDVTVYWALGGPPEHLTLPGLPATPVVFSVPCLEWHARLDDLLEDLATLGGDLDRAASRSFCLELMADQWLHAGAIDLSVDALLEARLSCDVWFPVRNTLSSLELAPLGEPYMVTWFFGLAHEIGHCLPSERRFALDEVRELADRVLSRFELPEPIAESLRARLYEPDSIIHPAHLREELAADAFAASVLWSSTQALLQQTGRDSTLRPAVLVYHLLRSLATLWALQTAAKTARHAVRHLPATAQAARESGLELLANSVAMSIRSTAMIHRLARLVAAGDGISFEGPEFEAIVDRVGDIHEQVKEKADRLEPGLAQAQRFALGLDEDPLPKQKLVDRCRRNEEPTFLRAAAAEHCERAERLGLKSREIDWLRAVSENPADATRSLERWTCHYVAPFVAEDGRGEEPRPFMVPTEVGNLVFVFEAPGGELFETFFEISQAHLPRGRRLVRTALLTSSLDRLRRELARSARGLAIRVLVENTREFDVELARLAQGAIEPLD